MTSNGVDLNRADLCPNLHAHEMMYEADSETLPSGQVWCVLTQTCVGPDGQVVDTDGCGPGRPCFGKRNR
jgi:hypothetical protein